MTKRIDFTIETQMSIKQSINQSVPIRLNLPPAISGINQVNTKKFVVVIAKQFVLICTLVLS